MLATREVSCAEVASAFLAAAHSDTFNAWERVEDDVVLARAADLDRLSDDARRALPLFGIPVAVKDNFDTVDVPTTYGSPIYAGHTPKTEAAVVTRLRTAGAVIAGKTKLAEFAWMHPSDTVNPLDPERTPGGSSSGSAAAVAAGTVPVATGTQTAGSVNRPASYCGVVGYKATFGLLPTDGIKPLAPTLDTVGLMARTAADLTLVTGALLGWRDAATPTPEALRLAFAHTPLWGRVEPDAAAAILRAIDGLRERGNLPDAELPDGFAELVEAQAIIQSFEAPRSLASELAASPDMLSDELRRALEDGARLPEDAYVAALETRQRFGPALLDLLGRYDGVLTPSTTGVPPLGLHHTGDPVFARAWNFVGAPSVSVPLARTHDGLPAGLQLIGAPGSDRRLLQVAARLLG
jgi:amidase